MSDLFTKKDAEKFKEEIKNHVYMLIEKSNKEMQKYLGILSEDFQHKLNLVIDGQLDIKREVGGLKTDVNILKKDVDELKIKTNKVHIELIAHRDNTEVHAQRAKRKSKAS